MDNILIRRYKKSDRPFVRALCCDTADNGQPCDSFFQDRELFADMWTRYHTDFESDHCWVADHQGHVVGYVISSFHQTRFMLVQFLWIFPGAAFKAFFRGTFFSPWMRTLIYRNIFSPKGTSQEKKVRRDGKRGHIHINIDKNYRGKKLGDKLVEPLINEARSELHWLTAGIRADNQASLSFFEKHGFVKMAIDPGFVIPSVTNQRIPVIEYEIHFEHE